MNLSEQLTKAAQAADLLLSDIRSAHSEAVKEGSDPLVSQLAHIVLLDLIDQAAKVERCLKALQIASNTSAR